MLVMVHAVQNTKRERTKKNPTSAVIPAAAAPVPDKLPTVVALCMDSSSAVTSFSSFILRLSVGKFSSNFELSSLILLCSSSSASSFLKYQTLLSRPYHKENALY